MNETAGMLAMLPRLSWEEAVVRTKGLRCRVFITPAEEVVILPDDGGALVAWAADFTGDVAPFCD